MTTPTTLKRRQVVLVGGGLTAGLLARRLVPLGIDVLVLERGINHSAMPETEIPAQRDELRWSTHQGLVQDWSSETYTMRHDPGQTALPMRSPESFLPGTGLGGAANHWNGQTWRFAESDSELRSRIVNRYGAKAIPADMPLADWGVRYAELEPHYDLLEKLFGVSGKAGNLGGKVQPGGNPFEAPRSNEYPQAPLTQLEAGSIAEKAAASLGYHPFPMPAANSSGAYTNPDGRTLGKCQFCGHCERFICEANAKASPLHLLYPLVEGKPNFETRLHANVLKIDYDARGRKATAVRYVDTRTGETFIQPADLVVLCAYTFTNTRLLLLSKIGRPYDPVTRKGVVGRNYCYQTLSSVPMFFKDRWINPFMAAGSSQTVIDDFNGDNFDHSGLGFLGGGYIYTATTHGRPIESRPLPPGTPKWGTEWKKANAQWYAHAFSLAVHGSCYPHVHNHLDLDPIYRDAFGQPLLRITFDFRENEERMAAWTMDKVVGIARATGADIVGTPNVRRRPYDVRAYQSTHNTGGTPMGADPSTSVVSPRLQHWDADNLFVVGASVYPHNPGYNPTGMLGALALRLGDDLVNYVKKPHRF